VARIVETGLGFPEDYPLIVIISGEPVSEDAPLPKGDPSRYTLKLLSSVVLDHLSLLRVMPNCGPLPALRGDAGGWANEKF